MSKSPEGYQPTEEEVGTAEGTMTSAQRELTRKREAIGELRQKFEKMQQQMNVSKFEAYPNGMWHGEINGISVAIYGRDSGAINGIEIGGDKPEEGGREVVEALYDKLKPLAELSRKIGDMEEQEKRSIDQSNLEINMYNAKQETMEYLRKDRVEDDDWVQRREDKQEETKRIAAITKAQGILGQIRDIEGV